MIATIAAAPDSIPLTAVLWLCPSVAEQLQLGLASPLVSPVLKPLVPLFEKELGVRLPLPQEDETGRAALARAR